MNPIDRHLAQVSAFLNIVAHCDWCGKRTPLAWLELTTGGCLCHSCVGHMPKAELERIRHA